MSKNTNKGLVPALRFPEFENSEEWKALTINAISSVVTDYVANGSFQSLRENVSVSEYVDYAYYIRLSDLRAGIGHDNQRYVDRSSHDFLKKSGLNGGEILVANIGANVGEIWQMPNVSKPATLAPNMIMVKAKKDISDNFTYYYLCSNLGKKYISRAIGGGAQPKINKTDLKQVTTLVPSSLNEQQKIADCLSSLDDLITGHDRKLEALQSYKKGLMQNLFPSEGETTPKLRFPEFKNTKDRETISLSKVCINISSGKDKVSEKGDYDLYGSTGVIGKTTLASYSGDFILVARVGANAGSLNRVSGKFGVTDNTLVISLKKTENIQFIFYFLVNLRLNKMVFGSGQPLITGKQLKKLNIVLPSAEEQKKIADSLSSLDNLINNYNKKIDALKSHKKGLMQQLFPSQELMEG